ncbi:MAG TPA: SDR family oxidoreductase [Bryobacteraceae bacterium]|nr:SDR family oxidoreductase [Bryobacteraceae bacterium]
MANVLITGTSSGIGLATALELARAGHKVFAAMRNPARAPEVGDLPISILQMDVDSDQSVADGFAAIYGRGEDIDVLVNNAGIERHGSVEEAPMEDFRAVMETNYFGVLRCTRQVLPRMRARGSGCIVNVSSVAGKISCGSLSPYTASKYALEALSEALAGEMKPFGVRVAVVEPGIIETAMPQAIGGGSEAPSHYLQGANMAALFRASLANPAPPTIIAKRIRAVIESGTWTLRHPCGPDAEPFLAWRASMTDEQWVDFNALDAAGFRERVKQDFGLDLDLPADVAHA